MIQAIQNLGESFKRRAMAREFGDFYVTGALRVSFEDFAGSGRILDIGGGGEGVIGRLKGSAVTAIDLRQEELDEAPGGFGKLVMDARELSFPDGSFDCVTAFFSFMYMASREDQEKAVAEAVRVLRPGGALMLWEVDTTRTLAARKDKIIARVDYRIGTERNATVYGARIPSEARDLAYYRSLCQGAGLETLACESAGDFLYVEGVKP